MRKRLWTLIILSLWWSGIAVASSQSGITYQGRIIKPDGSPLTGANVQFKLQLRTPNSSDCLMYEEVQALDMRNSAGQFGLTINDGTGSRTDSSGLGLDRLFANRGSFTFDPTTCTSGSSYTPSLEDGRRLVVLFKDETMTTWEPIPAQTINYVPYAIQSTAVQGFSADSLLRVVNGSGDPLTGLSPLSNAQYTELLALVNGTSTAFTKAGQLNGSAMPTMASGEVLGWNGTSWVSTSPVPGPSSVTTTMLASGAVTSAKLDPAISISTTGTVASAVTTTRDFKIFAASPSTFAIDMQAPALTASYSLVWPMNAGTSGQVLTTNGSGTLSWAAPAVSTQWTTHGSNISYDGGGNVGIGTTAPSAGGTAANSARTYLTLKGATGSGVLQLTSAAADGDGVHQGNVEWVDSNSTAADKRVAYIASLLSGSTAGNRGSYLAFGTRPDGSSATNESMKITNTGDIMIGLPGGVPSARVDIHGSTADATAAALQTTNSTSTNLFYVRNDGNIGIGTTAPQYALDVEAGTNRTFAKFGNSKPVYIFDPGPQDWSGIGMNLSYSGGSNFNYGKGSSNSYGGFIAVDPDAGGMSFGLTTAGGNAGAAASPAIPMMLSSGGTVSLTGSGAGITVGSSNATVYDPVTGQYPGGGAYVTVQSTSAVDGVGAYTHYSVNNSAHTGGRAYIGAVSNTGSYTPNIVFGQANALSSHVERMRIDSAGNVGVGTTSPSAKLDVAGTINAQAITINGSPLSASQASQTSTSNFVLNSNSDASGTDGGFSFQANATPLFTLSNAGDANFTSTTASTTPTTGALTVNGGVGVGGAINATGTIKTAANLFVSGNVGIGTTSPGALLDVGGYGAPTNTTNPSALFYTNTNNISGIEMRNGSSGTASEYRFNIYDNTLADNITFSMGGSNNSGTLFGLNRNSIATIFTNSTGTGRALAIGTVTARPTVLATNNLERLRIDSAGNVGIGTTSPVAKLDVAGGAIRSVNASGSSQANATAAIDWSKGNNQSMSVACTTTAFTNMLDGATYNLAVTDTTPTSCVFSQSGLTFLFTPANGARIMNQQTLYSFTRIGNYVYVAWATMQ